MPRSRPSSQVRQRAEHVTGNLVGHHYGNIYNYFGQGGPWEKDIPVAEVISAEIVDDTEQHYLQVLESQERRLGADHEDTQATRRLLGDWYRHASRRQEAENQYRTAARYLQLKLGPDHEATISVLTSLALTIDENLGGREREVENIYLRILRSEKRTLGVDHTNTLATRKLLGYLYLDWPSRHQDAEYQFRKLANLTRSKLGPYHEDTITALQGLGQAIQVCKGREDEAVRIYRHILQLQQRTPGIGHEETQWTRYALEFLEGDVRDRHPSSRSVAPKRKWYSKMFGM